MQRARFFVHFTRAWLTPPLPILKPGAARGRALRRAFCGLLGAASVTVTLVAGTEGLQDAVANGDTRTLSFYHAHTRESLTVTFRRNGRYDRAELQKLNWFLRDWRNDETTSMDPKLFDIVWAVQREAGSRGEVKVLSAYRSPKTNAMLRRRSSAVAKNSQHMQGRALDFALPDANMATVRAIGMRLQRGGVGYYPNVPFVHLDSGSVRSWPRMPRNQLARLFPDGKTVHLPADGRALDGYEDAKRMIIARGDLVPGVTGPVASAVASALPERRRSLWAALFGGADEEEDTQMAESTSRRQVVASASRGSPGAYDDEGGDTRRFFVTNQARSPAAQEARTRPAPAPAPTPVRQPPPAPVPVAPPVPVPAPSLPTTPLVIARQPVPVESAVREAPAVAAFDGPLPVARPDAPAPEAPAALPVSAPVTTFAMLPLPPRRPGEAPAVEPPAQAVLAAALPVSSVPLPPVRPGELGPDQPAAAGDYPAKSALAAIAAASVGASISAPAPAGVDTTIQTAALAYAPPTAPVAPPLPPARPVLAAPSLAAPPSSASSSGPSSSPARARMTPPLPAGAATVANDERNALRQLFAMAVTDAEPSPRARVSTAKVVAAAPAARMPAPVRAAAPTVVVRMGFSKDGDAAELSTNSFTGPAVKPLPVARFGQ